MGGFFIAATSDGRAAVAAADNARQQFQKSGLSEPVRIENSSYVLDYYPKHGRTAADLVRFGDTEFIASVGTFIYGNRAGAEALRLYWRAVDRAAALADCRGHFALIERRAGRTILVRDPLGVYEVYHDRNLETVSTSFLALARSLPRRTIHPAECLEYVFNGVTFGTETPIEEIQRLDIADSIDFDPTPRIVRHSVTLVPDESPAAFLEQLAHSISVLRDFVANLIAVYRDGIKISFSGGYDSRLLLALLRAEGAVPALFVYGPESAHDVRIAKEIATSEKIPLQHVDKDLFRPVTLDEFPDMVRQNFEWNDGFSQAGIFSSNAENILRVERSRGDAVVLNGGGGEVFRNFFKFPWRKISARNVVRCFFSHFDPEILAARSLHACFEEGLTRKVEVLLGPAASQLDRHQVACLYPHFRCRSWFGRANSIDNRFGNSVLPYYDRRVVEAALRVPLRWKHFGNLQSQMIRELDAALARHVTSHGFALERNTPFKGMIPDLLLYALPPSVRRFNFRIKQRLGRPLPPARAVTPPFLSAVMDSRFPVMSRLFALPRVRSRHQFERIATLEYMFQALDAGDQR